MRASWGKHERIAGRGCYVAVLPARILGYFRGSGNSGQQETVQRSNTEKLWGRQCRLVHSLAVGISLCPGWLTSAVHLRPGVNEVCGWLAQARRSAQAIQIMPHVEAGELLWDSLSLDPLHHPFQPCLQFLHRTELVGQLLGCQPQLRELI